MMRARMLTVGLVHSLLCVLVVVLVSGSGSALAAGSAGGAGCFDEQYRQGLSAGLPDCRAYELVTPPNKNGALIGSQFNSGDPAPVVAENGQDVIAMSIQCFADTPSCIALREREGEPYEFARTANGWVTRPLASSASESATQAVWTYDADTRITLFSAPSPPDGQDDWYAQSAGSKPSEIGPVSETGPTGINNSIGSIMAAADFSHVVYEADGLWTFGSPPLFEENSGLYEYVGVSMARPMLVGVTGGEGSTSLISICETGTPSGPTVAVVDGWLSADGRMVYFRAHGEPGCFGTGSNAGKEFPTTELFARVDGESVGAYTMLISAATPSTCSEEPCESASTEAPHAQFQGASSSGARAFFTSEAQLTDNGGGGGATLYESECEECEELGGAAAEAKRRLVDVSERVGGGQVPGGPRVEGVMAVASEGASVYFVAQGALTGEEENAHHERAVEGANNLYVHTSGEQVRFIADLPASDETEWSVGVGTANVTPDGRFLVFMSHAALTSDDTRGEGPVQVYRYDAQTRTLVRVSIGDEGFDDDGNSGTGDTSIVEPSRTLKAAGVGVVRADTTMSHDGRYVFFESQIALAPGALDDAPTGGEEGGQVLLAENIYEWESDGTGSCTQPTGCVSLISDGKDVSEQTATGTSVELLGSDAEGKNVFFQTNDQLVPEDTDTQRDFYDAHICSEAEPCHEPAPASAPPCQGEACQGASNASPAFATPSSATLTGEGNLALPVPAAVTSPKKVAVRKAARCTKSRVREHGRCVKRRKGKKGKSSNDRRAGR